MQRLLPFRCGALIAAFALPWSAVLVTAYGARGRIRRAAAANGAHESERESHSRAGRRTLRGSIPAGLITSVVLIALAVVGAGTVAPAGAFADAISVWPLSVLFALSCLIAGVALVAAARGAFAPPPADDPAYPDIARLLHAAQDARDEAGARRRRAAAERREAARRRRLSYSLAAMDEMDGEQFERLCGDYFSMIGYTVDFTPQSGDGGIDLVLTRDGELGVVQCKRSRKSVGEPVVRDLYGALHHTGAVEAFLCASSGFSPAAELWAQGKAITLLDGEELISALRRRR